MYRNYNPYPSQHNHYNGSNQYHHTEGTEMQPPGHPFQSANFNSEQHWDSDEGCLENFGGPNYNHNKHRPAPQRQLYENRHPHQNGFRGRGGRGRARGRGGRGGHGGGKNYGQPQNQQGSSGDQQFQHKAWMTDDLLKLLKERDELQQKAMQTRNPDDWSIFKAVRKRATLMMNDAKMLYELNKPLDEGSEVARVKSKYNCDTCDRGFPTEEIFNQHNAEHVTCKLDGCQFTAQPKVILKHIESQHSSNLYTRIKGFESPEEIQKWIELRKSKYPTEQNIQRKKEELAERYKRGERLPIRGGRGNWTREQDPNKFQRSRQPGRRNLAGDSNNTFQNSQENSNAPQQPCLQSTPTPPYAAEPVQVPVKPDVSCVPQVHEKTMPRYPPRPQFSFGDENVPKVSPEFKRCCRNVIVLESFYSQLRIGDNGQLIGKKPMLWNGETQKLCQKIARTGLPMKNAREEPSVESEDSEDDDNVAAVITDSEEDMEYSNENLSKDSTSRPEAIIEATSKPQIVKVEPSVQTTAASVTPNSSLCLVSYSSDSDSDGEAPEEIPAIILKEKEDGEINKGIENSSVLPSKTEGNAKPESNIMETDKNFGANGKKPRAVPINSVNKGVAKNIGGNNGRIVKRRRQPRMPKLLKKLLEDDIRTERNQILQVCRYIVQNNFFETEVSVPTHSLEKAHGNSESDANLGTLEEANFEIQDHLSLDNNKEDKHVHSPTPTLILEATEDKEDGQID